MRHISILIPESAVLSSIDDPRHALTMVNQYLGAAGKPAAFDIKLVGLRRQVKLYQNSCTIHPDLLLAEAQKTDLIFIPAFDGDLKTALEANQDFVPWIIEQHRRGAEVASLCLGAFLLAKTGLLNGKKCSTHWRSANEFREMFPEVNLVADKIITEETGLYSSGGALCYWNLLIYLIEKYTSREIAIVAAKDFAVDINRVSQSSFIIFKGQNEHADEPVKKAQKFIENNFQDKITVDQLSQMFAVGRRSFERRFKRATNNTVTEYIQRVKIEAAKKTFETCRKNISEVMFDVGYSDSKAFRGIFKKITGMTPVDYRNKYNKEN